MLQISSHHLVSHIVHAYEIKTTLIVLKGCGIAAWLVQDHAELDLSDAELQRVHRRAPRPALCKYFSADAATLSREIQTCLTDDAWKKQESTLKGEIGE